MTGLLLVAAAWGQDIDLLPEGTFCSTPAPRVIAGTAGHRTSGEAFQRAANTYSASAFAARSLLHDGPDAEADGVRMALDLNVTYGVVDVPVYHPAAVEGTGSDTTCDPRYQVASRPLDIETANVGFVYKAGGIGIIYATSLLYASVTPNDQFSRIMFTSFMGPTYAFAFAAGAPAWDLLIPGPGFGGIPMEWLLGLTADAGSVNLTAAYLSSVGGYLHVSERYSGAYLFYGGLHYEDAVFEAGLDRAYVPDVEGLGLTTAAYQDIPYLLGDGETQDPAEVSPSLKERLQVGRLAQQNIGTVGDVSARYRLRPDPSISELSIGLHTPGYHPSRDPYEDDYVELGALLSGGFVSTPAAWSQGLPAARLPSLRAAAQFRADEGRISMNVYYNDPEQLQLYPFARGALSYQILAEGAF